MQRSPPPFDRFTQAQPEGSMSNTLVLVGNDLVEVTPTSPELIVSSYDLAKGMQARFFFRRVKTPGGVMLDGYDVKACDWPANRPATIEPQRRFPSKDAAAMWAIHRSARG